MKLSLDFYQRADVVQISRELLGKVLVTQLDGAQTSGIIIETEAYAGIHDRASHSYGNRRTKRTEVMFGPAGIAYVYLCYGIHHLFNIVTNVQDVPQAVLVRAIEPLEGIDTILARRGQKKLKKGIAGGPGTSAQALGIRTCHSGIDLSGDQIWVEDRSIVVPDAVVETGPRIGIDYAGEDAALPYRFWYAPNS